MHCKPGSATSWRVYHQKHLVRANTHAQRVRQRRAVRRCGLGLSGHLVAVVVVAVVCSFLPNQLPLVSHAASHPGHPRNTNPAAGRHATVPCRDSKCTQASTASRNHPSPKSVCPWIDATAVAALGVSLAVWEAHGLDLLHRHPHEWGMSWDAQIDTGDKRASQNNSQ